MNGRRFKKHCLRSLPRLPCPDSYPASGSRPRQRIWRGDEVTQPRDSSSGVKRGGLGGLLSWTPPFVPGGGQTQAPSHRSEEHLAMRSQMGAA